MGEQRGRPVTGEEVMRRFLPTSPFPGHLGPLGQARDQPGAPQGRRRAGDAVEAACGVERHPDHVDRRAFLAGRHGQPSL